MKSCTPKLRYPAILLLLFLLTVSARATGAYDLLRIDPTVRGAALGGHPIALLEGHAEALLVNPAGLAGAAGRTASIAYADHPLDLAGGSIAYGQELWQGYGAASLTYFSYGEFERRQDFVGAAEGSFSPSDVVFSLGYGRELPHGIRAGGAARIIHSQIDSYTSTALAVDLGVMYTILLSKSDALRALTLAASGANLGTQLQAYDQTAEELPLTGRGGLALELEHLPLVLTGTAHYENGMDLMITGGGEFTISELLKLRGGYTSTARDFHTDSSEDGLAGLSVGIGLSHRQFVLDYAFHSQGALGQVHRLGFGARL